MASKSSSERNTHLCLTLNKKLKMIKLNEENIESQTASQVMNSNAKFLKEIKSATLPNT